MDATNTSAVIVTLVLLTLIVLLDYALCVMAREVRKARKLAARLCEHLEALDARVEAV